MRGLEAIQLALLHGFRRGPEEYSVEFTPCLPDPAGSAHDYRVVFAIDGVPAHARSYRMRQYDRQPSLGHSLVLRMAEAFRRVPDLQRLRLPFSLMPGAETPPKHPEPCCVCVGVDWLEFELWCREFKGKPCCWLKATAELTPPSRSAGTPLGSYTSMLFLCEVGAAVTFGADLREEVLRAEQARRGLGVEEWDEIEAWSGIDEA